MSLTFNGQHDPWGKPGKESLAGRLWSKMPGATGLKDSETYSEMWMGTYPTLPSRLASNGELLLDHLKKNPHLVGDAVKEKFGLDIPFLPKVLSFQKALPLQIHPDKALAERLHEKNPEEFGDSNHKPEIAIALSRFESFVGFKPLEELSEIVQLKPLQPFAPGQKLNDKSLRDLCKTMLELSPEKVSELVKQLQQLPKSDLGKYDFIPGLLSRLNEQYSQFDNGNLVAVLFMNYMILEPGEALCVPADSMHAYLSGDILECMARSDNVLNVGFCPRSARDNVELFSEALTFKPHQPKDAYLPPKSVPIGVNGKTKAYMPPFSEFNVLSLDLAAGQTETHIPLQAPSILIVTQGSGELRNTKKNERIEISEGNVFFVGPDAELSFSTSDGLTIYRSCATF
ncbi:hypothetical protein N7468_006822 [Penicillium chermesinum]|uniref:Mannose-6-phosphate isomerase n=1 Tax=Penicillium chermesinum TaxID=63820 RepID=A0A9W9NSX8_9EURO|nr:uncharacterized protein N7468_006822 [Penicillium chermesinum]KAJ5225597.1 hypothetical protein N7468_006822 [Penicillium chermesinum]KAJ6161184.1 hypothetical protein N7470_004580 [Penicillium chermesinum]